MFTVYRSDEFDKWLTKLKDVKGKARIVARIRSMEKFQKFDAAEYLDSEEMIAEYLIAALEDENPLRC